MTLLNGELHPTERELLDQLGKADPVDSQRRTLAEWGELIETAGDGLLVAPGEGEWSALEVLAHLTGVELTNGLRYRAMLVEETPRLSAYEVGEWSPILRTAEPKRLLALFRAVRASNLEFWLQLDEAGRQRTGIHPECGLETIELRFRMLAGHDRMHLEQARRAVSAAQGKP